MLSHFNFRFDFLPVVISYSCQSTLCVFVLKFSRDFLSSQCTNNTTMRTLFNFRNGVKKKKYQIETSKFLLETIHVMYYKWNTLIYLLVLQKNYLSSYFELISKDNISWSCDILWEMWHTCDVTYKIFQLKILARVTIRKFMKGLL